MERHIDTAIKRVFKAKKYKTILDQCKMILENSTVKILLARNVEKHRVRLESIIILKIWRLK